MNPARNASSNNTNTAPVIHFSTRLPRLTGRLVSGFWFIAVLLLLLICGTRVTCTAWFFIQKSELLHQGKLIKGRPFLFYFALHDPPDRDPGQFHFLPGGRQTVTGTGVGAARNPIHSDEVTVGN